MESFWTSSNILAVLSLVVSTLFAGLGIILTIKGIKKASKNDIKHQEIINLQRQVEASQSEMKQDRQKYERERNCIRWRDIHGGSKKLSEMLREEKFIPDFIFALSPRGAIIAECLTEDIGLNNIPVISGISQWIIKGEDPLILKYPNFIANYVDFSSGDQDIQSYFPKSVYEIDIKENKRILIIEDIAKTGLSLKASKKQFVEHGFDKNNIKTMSLVTHGVTFVSNQRPDFVWWVTTAEEMYLPWGQIL